MQDETKIKQIIFDAVDGALNKIRDDGLGGDFYISEMTTKYMLDAVFRVLEITRQGYRGAP